MRIEDTTATAVLWQRIDVWESPAVPQGLEGASPGEASATGSPASAESPVVWEPRAGQRVCVGAAEA